ncbi:MAG: undecaprenyldiphospho-muramoylpentapeptide beta-N-acetylglucosaminyltransferase [Ruminococcus sp.]|nr:undecaprenyldiphospho-muramoylpentapeptide beta-N-acetylglucosaminyltransferase [Ruminococcus sp.]
MKVLLAGGGTGGHINPALAIASIIQQHDPKAEFLFVGTPNGMEAKLVPQAGYRLETMHVAGFQRKLTLKNIRRNAKAAYYLATSQPHARRIVKQFQPDIAIGTGGYVAGPILHAAAHMHIPSVIHEQNAYPGVTNKMLSKEVDHVMLTVEKALEFLYPTCAYTVTGLPVRGDISQVERTLARKKLGFDDGMCILSFGCSLGAGCINEAMAELIPWHTKKGLKINHIHGYGGMGKDTFPAAMKAAGIPMQSDRLRITEYINDMEVYLAAADLVICRSGASTLAELEAVGRGSILIPSPIVTGNHQLHNANVLGEAGAAIVIEQKDASPKRIIEEVEQLYQNRQQLAEMGEKAKSLEISNTSERIWNVISELIQKA